MVKVNAYLAVYKHDWRKLKRSRHISHDRERSNRMLKIKANEYIILSVYEYERRRVILYLSGGSKLVVTLKDKRENDILITTIPGSNKLQGLGKYNFNIHDPIIIID